MKGLLLGFPDAIAPPSDKAEFGEFTSADFAMEMMEGVERVRFVRGAF